ncbi:MAG: winged helix-turn-helix transcriptional regulator [Promethearchaeota archaeon]
MTNKKRKFKEFKNDFINFYILNALSQDGRISYSELARGLGLTHISIKKRIEELLNQNIIKIRAELNYNKFNIKLGLLLLELDYEIFDKIIGIYEQCPRIIYHFTILGQYNLAVLFFGENEATFETMLKSCMLYNLKGIRKSNLLIIGDINKPLFFPFNFKNINLDNEKAPCGAHCVECNKFQQGICLGCPATKYYEGPFKIKSK